MKRIKIFFDDPKPFELINTRPLEGIMGLYFIFRSKTAIPYPFNSSYLIYIGMSEKRTNSIGKRLADHLSGQSGNRGLVNYRKIEPLFFTHINFEMLKKKWALRIEDLESYFINNFVKHYGVYPICNNKTSSQILKHPPDVTLDIDWPFFESIDIEDYKSTGPNHQTKET
ncbi:MAG: GIY-YIG nuclease family protein [bacterium]|nr:GIY-YIG nuclease family protein [bacterium]